MSALSPVPVIAIDGPTASGKGTVAQRVAGRLGFHYLDSGALYRLVALAALRGGLPTDAAPALAMLATTLPVRFDEDRIILSEEDVTDDIRAEAVGNAASRVAALGSVRSALLARQRAFRQPPGLVADGRDMASVVFPDAVLKVFLTATPEVRAERRYNQLMAKGMDASMPTLLQDIRERDRRDSGRSVAPLQQVAEAQLLDTTLLSIEEAVDRVLALYAAVA
jgi:cytidylate kinase